jgi:hypothetical protein
MGARRCGGRAAWATRRRPSCSDSGARRDVASDWGVSPLEVAVRAGRRECVRLFQVCGGGMGRGFLILILDHLS